MTERKETWTVRKLIAWATDDFSRRGIDTARLDAELLIAAALSCRRLDLYTGMDRPLEPKELDTLRQNVGRRRRGEPLAYILGEKEFWSLSFEVTPDVLVPRPDTETLLEVALAAARGPRLLELCTGSGCIAVSLAVEKPELRVDATDISPKAAAVARRNAERHKVADRVTVFEGDLFAPLPEGARYGAIVANPPYVPDADIADLSPEVRCEPRLALEGGADGLDIVRRILDAAPRYLAPEGTLSLEIDPRQAAAVAFELGPAKLGVEGTIRRDLAGNERVVHFANCLFAAR